MGVSTCIYMLSMYHYFYFASPVAGTVFEVADDFFSADILWLRNRVPCTVCAEKFVMWQANRSIFCGLTFQANRIKIAEYRHRAETGI